MSNFKLFFLTEQATLTAFPSTYREEFPAVHLSPRLRSTLNLSLMSERMRGLRKKMLRLAVLAPRSIRIQVRAKLLAEGMHRPPARALVDCCERLRLVLARWFPTCLGAGACIKGTSGRR